MRFLAVSIALAACQRPSRAREPEEIVNVGAATADDGLRVGDELLLSGPIDFEYDDVLRKGSLPILDEMASFLRAHREIALVEIQGHLDADRDREAYGRKLSQDRAEAVRDYLVHVGVPPDQLIARGYEDSVPLVPYDTPDAARTNRRIELRIVELR